MLPCRVSFTYVIAQVVQLSVCLSESTVVSIKLDLSAIFPQLVWKNTKEIGAANATRRDGFVVVVVRYSPAGNFNNAYKENVFPERKDSGGVGQIRSSLVFISFAVVTLNAFF